AAAGPGRVPPVRGGRGDARADRVRGRPGTAGGRCGRRSRAPGGVRGPGARRAARRPRALLLHRGRAAAPPGPRAV
ncbi:MAG: Glutaredoxin-like domain-containing protein PA3033, partial [uncultured Blastococcus sp.]